MIGGLSDHHQTAHEPPLPLPPPQKKAGKGKKKCGRVSFSSFTYLAQAQSRRRVGETLSPTRFWSLLRNTSERSDFRLASTDDCKFGLGWRLLSNQRWYTVQTTLCTSKLESLFFKCFFWAFELFLQLLNTSQEVCRPCWSKVYLAFFLMSWLLSFTVVPTEH